MTYMEILNSESVYELRAECLRLRQGLWDCFSAAGGDTDGDATPKHLTSDIVTLTLNTIEELREESGW